MVFQLKKVRSTFDLPKKKHLTLLWMFSTNSSTRKKVEFNSPVEKFQYASGLEGKKTTHPIEPAWTTRFFFSCRVGGWFPTQFEKYDRQNGIISPNF